MRDTAAITRTLGAALILLSAGVGCASSTEGRASKGSAGSPTSSSTNPDDFSGTHTVTYDDGLSETWTATSGDSGCAEVEQLPHPFTAKAQARLNGDQWTMEVSSRTETDCGDGTFFPGKT